MGLNLKPNSAACALFSMPILSQWPGGASCFPPDVSPPRKSFGAERQRLARANSRSQLRQDNEQGNCGGRDSRRRCYARYGDGEIGRPLGHLSRVHGCPRGIFGATRCLKLSYLSLLVGTKRMVGRCTASATASASRKSFFWPLRKGFTNCPGTSFTSWPRTRS